MKLVVVIADLLLSILHRLDCVGGNLVADFYFWN